LNPRIIAIVPMRHQSQRIPRKNYRLFGGRPLYHHIVETLLDCTLIDQVVIDTDSPTILSDATVSFPSVRLLERPKHLRDGVIAMNDVLLHTVKQLDADWYVQTHATNPLLKTQTIMRALEQFFDQQDRYNSLFSVTTLQTRIWDQHGQPVNHDPSVLLRTQDLPPIYEENSSLYVFNRQTLESSNNRIGQKPLMFPIERSESWDIDEPLDFEVAEFLYSQQRVNT